MTHHHSRFNRADRLMRRCRLLLVSVNNASDEATARTGFQRSPKAQKFYNRAKRLIDDLAKELKRW